MRAEKVSAKYFPGLMESSLTWPKASRCTSLPSASIFATMSLTPAPSEMKMLTLSCSSRIFLSRAASASMSTCSSGMYTACTSSRPRCKPMCGSSGRFHSLSRYLCAVAAVSQPQSRPITSWTIIMRGFAVASAPTFSKKRAPSSAAVHAPRDCVIGKTSLSTVLGSPMTRIAYPLRRWRKAARSAAAVFVSSPPMVCRTSTPSAMSWSAATCCGSCPSLTRPRLTQSLMLVSLTRELPIGEPPCWWSAEAVARIAGHTLMDSPSSRPL
mmetsp:Transcript_6413/g.21063  ORF Transcript_6413/g.21063 Transcript_6413/m.21063 type:complete len:269 (+) Transcript_6413:550-1356(+)